MDAGSAPTRTESPCSRVLVLAAPTSAEDREQARAFCAFLGLHGVEAWLELVTAGGAGELQALLDDDTVHWVLVVASPGFAELSARVHTDRHTIVPVVLPGGRAEELPAWADADSGRVVPVTEFSAEGAEPLLRIVLPLMAAPPPPPSAPILADLDLDLDLDRCRHRDLDLGHPFDDRRFKAAAGITGAPPERPRPRRPRAQQTTREGRRLHATVTDAAGRPRRHAFAPGQRNTVALSIAPGTTGIVTASVLPEESITFDPAVGAELTVVVVLDGPDSTVSLHRTLFLPPQGASTEVQVPVEVAPDAVEVCGAVLVLQRATVLQSAQLRGPVGEDDDERDGVGIRLETDAEITPDVAPPAREVDASLSFHVGGRGDALLAEPDRAGRLLHLPELDRFRDGLLTTLGAAVDADYVHGNQPGSAQQVELLRDLARQGHTLYQALEPQLEGATIGPRIQLLSPEDQVVPLEFVYDFGLPRPTARLCRHWLDALATGRCRCRPRSGPVNTVCPLGFWGLRFVIERQVASTTAVALGGDPSPGQMSPTRRTLPPLNRILFAASDKVDKFSPGERRRTVELLQECLGEGAVEVQSWRAWHRAVREHRPSVLLSLPHTEQVHGLVALQIGRSSIREVESMTDDYVVGPGGGVGPVVMLLGCNTAVTDIPWQSAVAAFRRRGASVVIGTLVQILGRQAAPLARHVAALMWGSGHGTPETIGELVQLLRRGAVAGGATLGMSLVAFGETGWRLPEAG